MKLQKFLSEPVRVETPVIKKRGDFNSVSLEAIQDQAHHNLVATNVVLSSNLDLMISLESYSTKFLSRGNLTAKDLATYEVTLANILRSHGVTASVSHLVPSLEDSEQDNSAKIRSAVEKVLAWIKQFIEDLGGRFKTYTESSKAVNMAIEHRMASIKDSIKAIPHQKEAVVHKVQVSDMIQSHGKLDHTKLAEVYRVYMGPKSLFKIEFPLKAVALANVGSEEFTADYRAKHEAYKQAAVAFMEEFEEAFGEHLYDDKSEVEVTGSEGLMTLLDMVSKANLARETYVTACDTYYQNAIAACKSASSGLDVGTSEGYEKSKTIAEFLRTASATHSEFSYFNKSFVKIIAQPLRDIEALVKAFS